MSKSGNAFVLLKKYPSYRLLLSSGIVTNFSTWATFIAFLVLLQQITRSGAELGIVWALSGLAPLVVSLGVGVYVDRLNRKKLLILTDFIRSLVFILFIVIPFLPHFWAILLFCVLRFINGIANSFNRVSKQAIVPQLFDKDDLISINATNNLVGSVLRLTGVSFGGLVISFISLNVIWVISSCSFIISMILMIMLQVPEQTSNINTKKVSFVMDFTHGVKAVWEQPFLRVITFSCITMGMLIGCYNLTIIEYVSNIYKMESYGMSILYVGEGLVTFIVSSIIAHKKFNFKTVKSYAILYILIGVVWAFFSFTDTIFVGLLVICFFALFASTVSPFEQFMLQTLTNHNNRGRVFNLLNVINLGMLQIGALFTGLAISYLGLSWVPIISGVIQIVFGLAVFVWCRDLLVSEIQRKEQAETLSPLLEKNIKV